MPCHFSTFSLQSKEPTAFASKRWIDVGDAGWGCRWYYKYRLHSNIRKLLLLCCDVLIRKVYPFGFSTKFQSEIAVERWLRPLLYRNFKDRKISQYKKAEQSNHCGVVVGGVRWRVKHHWLARSPPLIYPTRAKASALVYWRCPQPNDFLQGNTTCNLFFYCMDYARHVGRKNCCVSLDVVYKLLPWKWDIGLCSRLVSKLSILTFNTSPSELTLPLK